MIRYLKKVKETQSRAIKMVRDFVLEELYANWSYQDLAKHWGTTPQHVEHLIEDEDLSFFDLVMFLAFCKFDLGITIRAPSGKETTFYPSPNVGTLDHEEMVEEYLDYRKMEEDAPVEADGSYTIEEDPFADLGADVCENCMMREKIPDSLLCHPCIEAGVIANPPDDPDREYEIMAHIDREALHAQRRSRELAGLGEGDEFDELDLRLADLEKEDEE